MRAMAAINDIDIDVISLLILAFVFVNTTKRAEKAFTQHKLFMMLIVILSFLLVFDGVSRVVDGLPGPAAYAVNWVSNLLLFYGVPLVPGLWTLYADYQVHHDEQKLKRYRTPLWIVFVINGLFTSVSLFNGWFFTVGDDNIYRRGPLFLLQPILCFIVMAYTFVYIIRNKRRIEQSHLPSMLLFIVPPVLGSVLQSMFYGLSLILSSLTLSVLMLHFNIQDKRLDTDYLTGVYNRRLLDRYLKEKVAKARPFAAILIDLDGFKAINDTHGHIAGDNALLDAVQVLRGCLRDHDFIARYGGDEFFAAMDIGNAEVLADAVRRIKQAVEEFNQRGGRPYRLGFSIGQAVHRGADGTDAAGFLRQLDQLMYEDKKKAGMAIQPSSPEGEPPC